MSIVAVVVLGLLAWYVIQIETRSGRYLSLLQEFTAMHSILDSELEHTEKINYPKFLSTIEEELKDNILLIKGLDR